MALPLDRFCNRIVEWFKARMTESNFQGWMMRVELPPPGEADDEEMTRAFLSTQAGLRG
jgi:hypothetical protein